MTKHLTLLLFIGLVWSQDITIAVLDFETEGLEGISSNALSVIVRREVRNNKNYRLVDRNMMETVLKEQGFQQSGICGNECAVEVGQLLGVQKMVTGSISALGSLYLVEVFILDVGSGEIEKSEIFQHVGKIEELISPLIASTKKMFSNDFDGTVEAKSFVYVESIPSGAMVYLNDEMIGSSPIKYNLSSGKYAIKIKSQGYQDWSQTISVSNGENKVIKGTLSKLSSSVTSSGAISEWEIWGVSREDYLQLMRLGMNNDIWMNELIDFNVTVDVLTELKSIGYPIEQWATILKMLIDFDVTVDVLAELKSLGYSIEHSNIILKILPTLEMDITLLHESGNFIASNLFFLVNANKHFTKFDIGDLVQEMKKFDGGKMIFTARNNNDIRMLPDNLKKWISEKYECKNIQCYLSKIGMYKNETYKSMKDYKKNINRKDMYAVLTNMSVSNLLLLKMNNINERELKQILIKIYSII